MSFAQLTLVGNVGQMPEFKTVKDKTVCNFSMAVNRKVKGEKITTWFSVVSWDERKNEIIKEYVRKGDMLMVQGQLQPRSYTDKQGLDRVSLDVDISYQGNLILLPKQGAGGEEAPAPSGAGGRRSSQPAPLDDDMPF